MCQTRRMPSPASAHSTLRRLMPGQNGWVKSKQRCANAEFSCRSCGQPKPLPVVDLGSVPASDRFAPWDDPIADPRWPLRLHICASCHLVQLGPEGPARPEPQLAVDSATALAHAEESARHVVREERLRPGQTVIELDSSHGASWLPRFLDAGLTPVVADGQADLVVDVHHLMHEESLDRVLAAHAGRLAPGGVVVCEFLHLLPLVRGTLIDTIRHGHFLYPSLLAMMPAFERHGLTVTRATEVPVYGGSLRIAARARSEQPTVDASAEAVIDMEQAEGLADPETLRAFGRRGTDVATAFHAHLAALSDKGHLIAAYGAPSKAPVLLALADVDVRMLRFAVDLSPAKHGTRIPGSGIPIRPLGQLLVDRPDDVAVLTWDIADEIVEGLRSTSQGSGWNPRIYVPMPEPREFSLFD